MTNDKFNLHGRFGDILAFAAGAIMFLGFAPFSLFPVTVISPALLFLLWREISPWRAFLRGWLYGIGMFGIGIYWVHISIHQFGGANIIAAIALTVLLAAGMALYPALLGMIITRVFPRCNKVRLLVVLPAGWTLLEWLRGGLVSGFPWLLLGTSQIDSPLAGLAPLFGVYGVSWAVAFTGSLLVYGILARKRMRLVAVLAFVFLWGGAGALTLMDWTRPLGEPVEVALVQGNVPQEFKWMKSEAFPIMRRYLTLSREHRDAELVVWPETAIPLFYHQAGSFIELLEKERTEHETDFLIGIREYNYVDKQYFNAVISISEDSGVYRKRHLVPYGEFVPLRKLLGNFMKVLDVPMNVDFSSGEIRQDLLKAAGEGIGVSICYEDAFPEEIGRALPHASLLVNVSNDAWFGDSIAPHQHLQIARMRALEAGRYLLRATNTGISAIINEKGEITAQAEQFKIQVLTGRAQPYEGATPYALSGNVPLLLIMLVCLAAGIMLRYYWNLPRHRPPSSA